MITFKKKQDGDFVEIESHEDMAIADIQARLNELRSDGNEYRAEESNDCFSLIFDL